MMKYIILWVFMLGIVADTLGQYAYFPNSGTITYERKFHLHNFLKKNYLHKPDLDVWNKLFMENMVKNGPSEIVTKHSLKFMDQETLFETLKEDYPQSYRQAMEFLPLMPDSKTYVDHAKGQYTKLVTFGDDELLITDTIPVGKWKYTDEYRTIAGYECRRANGVVQDSIYVVAFFTNQIPVTGGPELVHGLPGTILGLSIPDMNMNIFATHIDLAHTVFSSSLTKKKKIEAMSKQQTIEKLQSSVFRWVEPKEIGKIMSRIFF